MNFTSLLREFHDSNRLQMIEWTAEVANLVPRLVIKRGIRDRLIYLFDEIGRFPKGRDDDQIDAVNLAVADTYLNGARDTQGDKDPGANVPALR